MGRTRINWFDVVGRALRPLPDRAVGRAIERLSATYREGRDDFDHTSAEGRAAYLWHVLPAHVCDLARLLSDLRAELFAGREALRVLSLGAGPGTDVLALLEALSAARERGEEGLPRLVEVERVERGSAWDESFGPLLGAAAAALEARGTGLALLGPGDPAPPEGWGLRAGPRALVCDLAAGPPPEALRAAWRGADLVVAANLLSEVAPRGGDALPAGLEAAFRALLADLRPGAALLLVDRAGAPGAAGRVAAVADLARALRPGAAVEGPRQRATRCACALTRKGQQVYQHVHLPTTRDADRPVRNCESLWCLSR